MRVRANESERGPGASGERGVRREEREGQGASEEGERCKGVRIVRGDRDGQRSNTRCSALYINLILFDL